MNDTVVTVVGNVATGVEFRETATGGVARFRFAVSPRRWDRRRGDWADGPASFYTVWAWRALGANLAASVAVGEPLVVHGRLRVREEEKDGRRWTSVDIDAVAVGHDLTRGTSAFRRATRKSVVLTEGHEWATQGQGAARVASASGPEPSAGLPAGLPAEVPDGLPAEVPAELPTGLPGGSPEADPGGPPDLGPAGVLAAGGASTGPG
ncbi:single-stranded DNA-binding protein [Streptomyces sp. NBC_01429]|uniref:single-stranded DNA-binding protein n=1 Tax=Streptomyces sp. NBC_01429 TaxID=2903862 RepID=UPI002E2D8C3B|nr:single-stranded DNA-binding protein [Streptomyces sp. NBC_01429]